jgi:membrane protein DedA with SNARE-associated domain
MPGFDELTQLITDYPYIGVAAIFLLCGLGLPLPEEIVLLAAGFVCAKYPDHAKLLPMMGWCATAILVGDMIPFLLGRTFGVRLLRLRWLRYLITKQRLVTFDRWFRRRGDMVIVISRFLAGLRMVAFFTAGAMKMRWSRFLLLDGLGIVLIVPLLTWIGFSSAGFIEEVIAWVEKIERGLLWGTVSGSLLLAGGLWLWRRRRQQKQRSEMTEEFVQPKKPVNEPGADKLATDAGDESPGEFDLEPLSDAGEPLRDEENESKTESGSGGLTGETGGSVNP